MTINNLIFISILNSDYIRYITQDEIPNSFIIHNALTYNQDYFNKLNKIKQIYKRTLLSASISVICFYSTSITDGKYIISTSIT